MHAPHELVEMKGQVKTKEFDQVELTRCFRWKISIPKMPCLLKKMKNAQINFIEQRRAKETVTVNDIDHQVVFMCQVSEDRQFLKQNFPETSIFIREQVHGRLVHSEA